MQQQNPSNLIPCLAITAITGIFVFLLAHALRAREEARAHGNHTAHHTTNTTTLFFTVARVPNTDPGPSFYQFLWPMLIGIATALFMYLGYRTVRIIALLADGREEVDPLVADTAPAP